MHKDKLVVKHQCQEPQISVANPVKADSLQDPRPSEDGLTNNEQDKLKQRSVKRKTNPSLTRKKPAKNQESLIQQLKLSWKFSRVFDLWSRNYQYSGWVSTQSQKLASRCFSACLAISYRSDSNCSRPSKK